jgi:type IV secretory pathway protease TraF
VRPRTVILSLVLCGVLLAIGSFVAAFPLFVWNFTRSAPIGLYLIERGEWSVGDRVAVRPSPLLARMLADRQVLKSGRVLIKTVAAGAGDRVCRLANTVSINGVAVATTKERAQRGDPLPTWSGCVRLSEGEVFLLGETAASFDGRYWGVTADADILGRAELLFDVEASNALRRAYSSRQ